MNTTCHMKIFLSKLSSRLFSFFPIQLSFMQTFCYFKIMRKTHCARGLLYCRLIRGNPYPQSVNRIQFHLGTEQKKMHPLIAIIIFKPCISHHRMIFPTVLDVGLVFTCRRLPFSASTRVKNCLIWLLKMFISPSFHRNITHGFTTESKQFPTKVSI